MAAPVQVFGRRRHDSRLLLLLCFASQGRLRRDESAVRSRYRGPHCDAPFLHSRSKSGVGQDWQLLQTQSHRPRPSPRKRDSMEDSARVAAAAFGAKTADPSPVDVTSSPKGRNPPEPRPREAITAYAPRRRTNTRKVRPTFAGAKATGGGDVEWQRSNIEVAPEPELLVRRERAVGREIVDQVSSNGQRAIRRDLDGSTDAPALAERSGPSLHRPSRRDAIPATNSTPRSRRRAGQLSSASEKPTPG